MLHTHIIRMLVRAQIIFVAMEFCVGLPELKKEKERNR